MGGWDGKVGKVGVEGVTTEQSETNCRGGPHTVIVRGGERWQPPDKPKPDKASSITYILRSLQLLVKIYDGNMLRYVHIYFTGWLSFIYYVYIR